MTVQTQTQANANYENLAQIAAERIYNRLSALPPGWIHGGGGEFLPANVLCDYAGQKGFINLVAKVIADTFNDSK